MPGTITLSSSDVIENPENGTIIGKLTVNGGANGETFTFSLANSLSDRFEIKQVTENSQTFFVLAVKTGGSLFDFEVEALHQFTVSITATGSQQTSVDSTSFTIDVTNVNEAPTDILLPNATISENVEAGATVGSLWAPDPDATPVALLLPPTFELLDNAGGRFRIADGKLLVAEGATFDFETSPSHQVRVKVTDAGGLSFEKTLTVSVTDVSEIGGSGRNEKLRGTNSADMIDGGAGNDWIWGMGGDDVINGGAGKDILYGGDGKDTFLFNSPFKKGHFDQVRDFNSADDSFQFDLAALKAFKVKASKKDLVLTFAKGKPDDKGKPGDKGKADDKKSPFSLDKVFKEGKLEKKFFSITKPKDSNDYVYYNKKNGTVYLDADGSGKAKGIEILKVKPGTTVSADDFLFI